MDTDADIDTAAEDPPALWLTVAVVGIVLAVAGLVAGVLTLLGVSGAILSAVPVLGPLFGLSPFVAVIGFALFVFAMTEWSPELED